MKRNLRIALVVALAAVASVETAVLLGLHKPFMQDPQREEVETPEFQVLDEPFSSRMATSKASPGTSLSFPNAAGPVAGFDPFAEMERMRKEMDERMGEMMRQMQAGTGAGIVVALSDDLQSPVSPIAVNEKDDRYVCTLRIEGVDEPSIQITVENTTLTVAGTRTIEKTQENHGRVVAHIRHTEQFSRSTALPAPVNASCMNTKLNDGVLTIELPKATPEASPLPLP